MYTVEISPPTWKQLARLPVETYRRIREELEAVALALSEGRSPVLSLEDGQPGASSAIQVDDTRALYDVDPMRRCVLLLEVERHVPKGP